MANKIEWSMRKVEVVAPGVHDVVVPFTFEGNELTEALKERILTAYRVMVQPGGKLRGFHSGMRVELVGIQSTGNGRGAFTARQMHG